VDINEIKKLTKEELVTKLADLRKELDDAKFNITTGALKNSSIIANFRKDIARVLTVVNAKGE